ncbi:MAG: hypothetical protein QM647_12310 [Asticcacaulis sp.]|uniref:hypothetical protein n=1 Tax=Asticcacaulis sp. TaxID=1872648 RepID=UPI0039E4E772
MAIFVHLTSETNVALIRRNGIAATRWSKNITPARGVFATPVTPDFYKSHQWLRELARQPGAKIVAVYFRLKDNEPVYLGRYRQAHILISAAEAVSSFMKQQGDGVEVIIPCRIAASNIVKIKSLPQTIGWRYYPEARGKLPSPSKGSFGSQKTIKAVEAREVRAEALYYSRFPADWYSPED